MRSTAAGQTSARGAGRRKWLAAACLQAALASYSAARPVDCGNPPPASAITIRGTPNPIQFALPPGGSASQSLALSEVGGASANNWTASRAGSWISISSTTGSCSTSGCGSITVGASAAGLAGGTYTGAVNIVPSACNNLIGNTVSITVILTVASISLSASPATLALSAGGERQTVTLTVARTNYSGDVSLAVEDLPTGVSASVISPGTGSTGTLQLQADAAAPAVSNRQIRVTATGDRVPPASTTLSLSVVMGAVPIPAGASRAILPHSAFGAGYISRLFVTNLADSSNAMTVNRISQSGAIVETRALTLPPGGSTILSDSEQRRGESATVHWWAIGSERALAASILFDFDGQSLALPTRTYRAAVGTLAAPPLTDFSVPVRVATEQVTVGMALVNLASSSNQVNLRLLDRNGSTVGQDSLSLAAYGQTAFSVQDRPAFRNSVLAPAEFIGSLVVTTADPSRPVAAIVVGNNLGQLFSLPVTPRAPGIATIPSGGPIPVGTVRTVLPHSAFGGGYISRLSLTNLSTSSNLVTVNRVSQAGTVVQTTTHLLPPRGAAMIADSEAQRSQMVTVQWFAIGSEHPVSASVLFEFDGQALGLAPQTWRAAVGTLAATPTADFTLPVRVATEQVTMGIALANQASISARVTMRLRDRNGVQVAEDFLTLGPYGQTAFVLHERAAFRNPVLTPSEFIGSLVVTSDPGTQVTAIVVGNNLGQLFSLPVSTASSP